MNKYLQNMEKTPLMDIAIIIIAYKRIDTFDILLKSLLSADYGGEKVDLVFSIDYSGNEDVLAYAERFIWPFGNKIIRYFNERQGLKKHILSCGEYFSIYDALIILEDDLIVGNNFFSFAKQAAVFYRNDDKIAGISLYSHSFNVNAGMPFQPALSGSDVYFMSFAQSWGQVWLKKTWSIFLEWIKNFDGNYDENTPSFVNNWPQNSSWLKLHIKFCQDTNRFFVYPYESFTSIISQSGEHGDNMDLFLHRPVCRYSTPRKYLFDPFSLAKVKYDVFFERIIDYSGEICVDLYSQKKIRNLSCRFLLTTRTLNQKIIGSFSLKMLPHEENFFFDIPGKDIFLYEIDSQKPIIVKSSQQNLNRFFFYFPISYKGNWKFVSNSINALKMEKFRNKLKHFFLKEK